MAAPLSSVVNSCRLTDSPGQRRRRSFRMPGKARRGSAKAADAPRCAAASETTAAPENATAAKENAPAAATGTTAASAATAATSDAAATTTSAATATTVTSTAAAAARHLREAGGAVFLVEEMERRKTDVGHFLFAKNEALIGYGAQRLRDIRSRNGGCGCATHQRKAQSRGAQRRRSAQASRRHGVRATDGQQHRPLRGGRRSADRDARCGQGIEIWRPRCRARRAWPRLLA